MSDESFRESRVEQENYFVSMTDMMVGLVFIFIILLMYFALQFQQTRHELTSADETRRQILQQLQTSLKAKGVKVEIDPANGLLHLPEAILFDSAQTEPKPGGRDAIAKLASSLMELIPCYAEGVPPPSNAACKPSDRKIESMFIEGHTDSDPLTPTPEASDNWDLSVKRATNTYRELIRDQPDLARLCSTPPDGKCQPIISVSGYADQRPAVTGNDDAAKAQNRRIDVRLLMVSPSETYRKMQSGPANATSPA
ncbi:MAG TPA: hypothetical protein VGL58_09250 [Caulobacteraceae bacterium]|jgi:flagellar motor protein MotB